MEHKTELIKAGQVASGFDMESTYMVVCSCGHRTKARVYADAIIDKARHDWETEMTERYPGEDIDDETPDWADWWGKATGCTA